MSVSKGAFWERSRPGLWGGSPTIQIQMPNAPTSSFMSKLFCMSVINEGAPCASASSYAASVGLAGAFFLGEGAFVGAGAGSGSLFGSAMLMIDSGINKMRPNS